MKTLTDEQQRFLVDEFSADPEDPEGLFAIAHAVEHLGVDPDAVREQTLLIVEQLLSKGMAAGNSPYHPGGYQPWPNQDRSAVIDRIRSEWIALGRSPYIPEIAWFGPADHA